LQPLKKTGTANDYSAAALVGEAPAGFYLLHVWRERVEFLILKRKIVELATAWKPGAVLVEDKASGQSLIQELRSTNLPVLPIRVDTDKESRAHAVSPLVEAGRLFLPPKAPWLADVLDEVTNFPSAPHDDQVDALVQALGWLRHQGGGNNFIEYLRLSLGEPAPSEPEKPLPWAHDKPPGTDNPLIEAYQRALADGATLLKSRCASCREAIAPGAVYVDDGARRWHKGRRPPFGFAAQAGLNRARPA
jgi:predicted phage terminase large subunit-like protein